MADYEEIIPVLQPLPTVELQRDGRIWVRADLGGVLGDEWIEHLDGIPWFDRPAPRRWHRCCAATRGSLDGDLVERCACGATRFPRRWRHRGGKNERRNLAILASYLVAHPDQKYYGWDTAKATGLRPAVMYRLLWRFLDVGWLTDGWETPPPVGRPPRRYYVHTDLGRAELSGIAQAGERRLT